ncbi:MAG: hypothetical protein GF347_01630 [Candidatus Moranbacteria bacterium]|nr:hypothetical protein [Candidatus Moranbacteria bacterium]
MNKQTVLNFLKLFLIIGFIALNLALFFYYLKAKKKIYANPNYKNSEISKYNYPSNKALFDKVDLFYRNFGEEKGEENPHSQDLEEESKQKDSQEKKDAKIEKRHDIFEY